ncbi:UvrD-helicase domain-containing protein [Deinococcus antarcticus]|uniref:DNA 3'-5' helicase n=1 Tax=Deinococcus antarcticus TaxID=1298767 RepID=A0ABV8A965_9DEIO
MTSHLTPEQEFITFYQGSVSIDAGAGSGKTFVLTRRILNLLTRGLKAEELVAVTFTEAAAAELRSRLQALLDSEAARGGVPEVIEAARALPLAQISTIHALCARLIREHPVESGAGLRFSVLDQSQASVWLERWLPEVLGELPASDFGDVPADLAVQAVRLMLADPQRAEQALRESMQAQEAEQRRLQDELAQATLDAQDTWQRSLTTLRQHAASVLGDPLEVGRQAVLQAAEPASAPHSRLAVRQALAGIRRNAGSAAAWGGHKDTVHRALNDLRIITQPLMAEQQLWQCRALLVLERLYYHAQARLDDLKAQQEVLTFADLERLAARALSDPQVREYYAQRFKALLVDEFQDTSPLQWEILSALSGHGLNFTVVGDEKQSIYAFRGADVTLFREARAQVSTQGGETRALTTSFRSHQALVDVINTFFEAYMPGPASPVSTAATFTPLRAHRQHSPHPSPPCELHVVGGAPHKDTLRQAEAKLLAHRIQNLMHEGRTVGGRPLAYRDIALLLRARTKLHLYEAALFQAGIPYAVQGGTGLLRRPEVRDLSELLHFLANPADDLALAALLRSPLLHWTDEKLVRFTRERGEETLWNALLRAGQAPALLRDLLPRRASRGASALITLALEHSDFAAVMASLPDGPRRLANVDAFLGLLHAYAAQGRGDVQQVSRLLRDSVRLDLPVPEATLGADDAVQLMTIHGSKGLEYPVVMLPDLLAEGHADSAPLLMHPELGLSLRVPGRKPEEQPEHHQRLLDRLAEQRLSEDERVRYVALTRAADLLILSASAKTSELSQVAYLSDLLPQEQVARYHYQAAQIPAPERLYRRRGGEVYTTSPGRAQALPETLPATSIGVYLHCPRAFEYRYISGRPPFTALWDSETQQREGGVSGAIIGSAVHQAIELGLDEKSIQARFTHLSPAERNEVARLTGGLNTPAFAALQGLTPLREVQVTHRVGPLSFEGVIDALYDDWIVDYKTDRSMNPHHHLPQLALYCSATGVSRASLAYLRHDTLYECSPADLQSGLDDIDRVVQGVTALNFAPTPSLETCRFCTFRQVCSAAVTGAQE